MGLDPKHLLALPFSNRRLHGSPGDVALNGHERVDSGSISQAGLTPCPPPETCLPVS